MRAALVVAVLAALSASCGWLVDAGTPAAADTLDLKPAAHIVVSPTAVSTATAQPLSPSGPPPSLSPAYAESPSRSPAYAASPSPSPSRPDEVTVALAGDVHGEPPVDGVLASGGNPLAGAAHHLAAADVAVVNLETAVGSSGTPYDKEFTFQADPALLDALAAAGVDVVNLANNHALDYGLAALDETVTLARDAGLVTVGAGPDAASAYAPAVFEVDGRRIAVVGMTRVMSTSDWAATPGGPGMASAYDPDAAAEAVRAASAVADHVVVTVHWGDERTPCPVPEQLLLADALARAGADVIAGHHPHVLQGIATIGDTLVAYSLGNFVWYPTTASARTTGVLTVTLGEGGADHSFAPAYIDAHGRPQPLAGEAAERVRDLVAARSPGGAAGCDFDTP